MQRRRTWGLLTAAILMASTGCSGDDGPGAAGDGAATATTLPASDVATPTRAEGTGLLYVQLAATAVATPDGGDAYQLELTGVEPSAIAFTDRPARRAGPEPTASVVAQVAGADDPPNAALVWYDGDGERSAVVELLDGEYDEASSTVRYRLRALDSADEGAMRGFPGGAALPEGPFGPASLYIDSFFGGRTCTVAFTNSTGGPLRYGNVAVESGNTIESGPVQLEGWDYPIDDYPETNETADSYIGTDEVVFIGGAWSDNPELIDMNVFPAGTTSSAYEFDSDGGGCGGWVQILEPTIDGSAVATYHFDDPYIGSNSHRVDCADGYTCSISNSSDGDTLSDTVTICTDTSCG